MDELIGPGTVNTVPAETFQEFRCRGHVRPSMTENWAERLEQAQETMRTLAAVGISMKEVTDHLLSDGVQKFSEAFDKLLAAVEKKRQTLLAGGLARQSYELRDASKAVERALTDWRAGGKVRRLWSGDATLWSGTDEADWLGWLHLVQGQRFNEEHLKHIGNGVKGAGFRHAVVLGMGGSSLCPEVMRRTFGVITGFPELVVLDSTVPAQIRAVEQKLDLRKTLFLVSSKSGGTTETNVLKQYFFAKVQKALGDGKAGDRFLAVTDPGTKLHQLAKSDRFREIVHGEPTIGGRYSALSNFGMVPATVMGVDVPEFLDRTEVMVHSCASSVPPEVNPGVMLGVVLGTLAQQGRDKVTLVASPGIGTLGAWLEQLIAESTGKEGKGLVPVDGERLGPPEVYGPDRVFVSIGLKGSPSQDQDKAISTLERAGHPVVRIVLEDPMDLGQEFFRWEIATAVAGSMLGINAFNQPDVEASKVATRKLTAAYEETGKLPETIPLHEEGGLKLFTDGANAEVLKKGSRSSDCEAYLAAHLKRIQPGDYFAVCAYLAMSDENHKLLQGIRHDVRNATRGSDDPGLWAALSPFHGAAPQGWTQHRCLSPGHLGRCPGPSHPGSEIHLRSLETGSGAGRF